MLPLDVLSSYSSLTASFPHITNDCFLDSPCCKTLIGQLSITSCQTDQYTYLTMPIRDSDKKKYFFFQMSDTFRRAHFFPVCDLWSQDSNFCLYFLNLYICLMILSITLYLTKLNKAINRISPLICLMNLRHLSMIPWILNSYLMFQCFNPCQENKCHMSTSSCCHII